MPTAGAGLKASLLGATMRLDGRIQATYAGFPLYWYSGDTKPGEVRGEGSQAFGAG
jgi:predicted lipoprotein with Yx(FWY)xxD motif